MKAIEDRSVTWGMCQLSVLSWWRGGLIDRYLTRFIYAELNFVRYSSAFLLASISKMGERTEEERKTEVRKIIMKLSELKIGIEYEAIKELYGLMRTYTKEGRRIRVNIPFPEFGRDIVGCLEIDQRKEVTIMMTKSSK